MAGRRVHENDAVYPAGGPELDQQEYDLRREMGDDASWIDILKAGLDMEAFEESPAGQTLAAECLDDINEAFNIFLELDDPFGSQVEIAKVAYMKAKIALGTIDKIRKAIGLGREAESKIAGEQEPSQ